MHSSLWRVENIDEASIVETNTNIIQICSQNFTSKPTLMSQYDALKANLLDIQKATQSEKDGREKIVIGITCTEAGSIIKELIKKIETMQSKEKTEVIARISETYDDIDDFEQRNYVDGPLDIMKALFERLICKTSLYSDIGFVDLNASEMSHEKKIIENMLAVGYNQSGINDIMCESQNNDIVLQNLAKDSNERISKGFLTPQTQSYPHLKSALLNNNVILNHYLMSQVIIASGIH
ncbi:MAG: hypothetical protein J6N72_11500 [Psychrobacter sp.]|nr:hypothetical protein [Psychrobacter sp.]